MKKKAICFILIAAALCTSCSSKSPLNISRSGGDTLSNIINVDNQQTPLSYSTTSIHASNTSRDNTPECLVPSAPGIMTDGNDLAIIDYSNATDGYIQVNYLGTCKKVKLQILGPDNVTYTYNLQNGYVTFPLSSGDGEYTISVCENIADTRYSIAFRTTLGFENIDEFGPYLYPNQYVNFTEDSKVVTLGANLASASANDLEVLSSVYNYVINNITYDYDKANTVASGYLTDLDEILTKGAGICLDYAAVCSAMLRSQGIPTRLEVGYASEVYHAWISVYIEEIGWLNGVIQFNGHEWSLVDPTFGASTNETRLRKYIGEGTNYSVKYVY